VIGFIGYMPTGWKDYFRDASWVLSFIDTCAGINFPFALTISLAVIHALGSSLIPALNSQLMTRSRGISSITTTVCISLRY